LKVLIAAIWLGVGARAGFPVGGVVVQLFLDLGASIWGISVLLLLKTDTKKTTGPQIPG